MWTNNVQGLCGNFDGMSESGELIKSDGTIASNIHDFATSWTVDTTCDESAVAEEPEAPCAVSFDFNHLFIDILLSYIQVKTHIH